MPTERDDAGTSDAGGELVDAGGPDASLDDGLVGHYPFDEDDGGRRATDLATARHGTLTTGARLEPDAGRFQGGLRVTSGGAVLPASLLSGPAVTSFAFSLWFRADAVPTTTDVTAGARLLTLYRGGGDRVAATALIPGDGTDAVWFLFDELGPGNAQRVVFADAGLTPDRWHHVAFSWDADAGVARAAFDGQRWAAPRFVTSVTGVFVPVGHGNLLPRSPAQFVGSIDDVRLWRRALTPDDLSVLWVPP